MSLRALLVALAATVALAFPAAASAMDQATATWWASVDGALLRNQHGYSSSWVAAIWPWGGGWGTYGWTASITFTWPGGICTKPINLWGASTQEGWNPQPPGYGTCGW